MAARSVSLLAMASLAVCVSTVSAQQTLGDLVATGGYDWVIGRWVATTDDGQKIEVKYDWALDKNVVVNDIAMGEFKYHGLIMLASNGMEAVDTGADNRGGVWKGSWQDDGADLIHKVEHTGADGEVHKGEIVHTRVDADTITIAYYAVDGSGVRASDPWGEMTYKRQPAAKAAATVSAAQGSRSTDYQKLGDLVADAGYDWLIGKWTATQDGRQYTVENKSILDGHAAIMEARIDDFRYCGLITFAPSSEQISQIGADNMGGTWKSTWDEGDDGPVHKIEYARADGTTQRMEHDYVKTDKDTFTVTEYAVESGGSRVSEPRGTITFTRQKPAAP